MNLTITIPDDLASALRVQAHAHGLSPDLYVSRVLENTLGARSASRNDLPPFETGYGIWAQHGPAPSAQEIDDNRREMFRSFAQDA